MKQLGPKPIDLYTVRKMGGTHTTPELPEAKFHRAHPHKPEYMQFCRTFFRQLFD